MPGLHARQTGVINPLMPNGRTGSSAPECQYRTIWISDLHLGTRDSQTAFLADFLGRHSAETLFLVGDIVDGWALQRSWFWDSGHDDVVNEILRHAREGTRVIYIPGNHDEFLRKYIGFAVAQIEIALQWTHRLANGRKMLVVHGDQFDGIVKHAKWLSVFGASAYRVALSLNRWFNQLRNRLGMPYWSLSAYLKQKTKRAVQYIADFESAIAETARDCSADGVICGHIHHPEMRYIDGIQYCNTGDWVESCTALVEHHDGRLELVEWIAELAARTQSGVMESAAIDLPATPVPLVAALRQALSIGEQRPVVAAD